MSDFINTIDLLGDNIVFKSILDRSIVEFKDNVITYLRAYSFRDCASLTTVDLPSVIDMNADVFNNCQALVNVNLPNLMDLAGIPFKTCSSLKTITLHSVTDASYGFRNCASLTTVDLPIVTTIGDSLFGSCPAVETLILRSNTMCKLTSSSSFDGTKIAKGTGYIYVPRALLSDDDSTKDYRRATNWTIYQFRALEDYTVDGTTTGALDESKI